MIVLLGHTHIHDILDMNRAQLATTITRRDAGVEPPWMVDICSSAIAPALPYYRPSMDICNICISYIV